MPAAISPRPVKVFLKSSSLSTSLRCEISRRISKYDCGTPSLSSIRERVISAAQMELFLRFSRNSCFSAVFSLCTVARASFQASTSRLCSREANGRPRSSSRLLVPYRSSPILEMLTIAPFRSTVRMLSASASSRLRSVISIIME